MRIGKFHLALVAVLASTFVTTQALASGFEKSIPWGGRSAGVGGIATPWVTGSQALYFNPAGLVGDELGRDFSLNLSPTFSQFKGPVSKNVPATIVDATGERTTTFPFGLLYGATVSENLGYGVGVYVAGGSNAKYEEVDLSPRTIKPNIETIIQVIELAAGLGYRVSPELKLGAAWRVAFVRAKFAAVAYDIGGAGTIANLESSDLTATESAAFKLGAQYKIGESTRLGASFRSELNFDASGDISGRLDTGGASLTQIPSTSLTANTTLPMALSLGVSHDFSESWRLMSEYVFTQYSKVDKIELIATVAGSDLADFQTKWKDQHNVRLGGEYLGWSWPTRIGYVYTSQVTDENYARPSFTPPGAAHTVTLGTGKALAIGDRPMQLDGAFEYTTTEGDGVPSSPQAKSSPVGAYSANAYVVHLGLSYHF